MITSLSQTIPLSAIGDFARAYQPGTLILLPDRQTNQPHKWRVIAFESVPANSHPRFGNQSSVTITLEQTDLEPDLAQWNRSII
jgi:hypothetical protein